MEQNDIQELVDNCHRMAERLLIDQGEFFPLGAYIDIDGKFTYSNFYDGDEFPLSDTVIRNLKNVFEHRFKRNEIRAYAITYDSRVTSEDFLDSIDCITMSIKHIEYDNMLYYFPYLLLDGKIEFLEPWAENAN